MESKIPSSEATSADDPALTAEAPTVVLGETDLESADHTSIAETPRAVAVNVGDILGQRFRLIELIGEGGMSRVYKAIDSQRSTATVDEYVAVKVLARPFQQDAAGFALLQAEIDGLRTLTHPNILRLLSCGRQDATLFIAMEHLTGRSLYERLRSQAVVSGAAAGLDRDDARSIITAVGAAVEYAHQNGVVHGDLKPGNVIITEVGEVKVIDFRVAYLDSRPKTALERREGLQRSSSALTPRYASPQLLARHKPEITDDVYALACLAYELLTGRHPFDDGNGTQSLRFPLPRRAGLSPVQHEAITHALQLDQRDRTPTVPQFLREFSAAPARAPWKSSGLAVAAVALLGLLTWFYFHASPRRALPSAPRTAESSTGAPAAARPAEPDMAKPVTATTAPAPRSVVQDCRTCPLLTIVPPGSFSQGAEREQGTSAAERPRHAVVIGYSLAIQNRDVTVGEFREFVTATGRDMRGCDVYDGTWRSQPLASWENPGFTQSEAHPVTCTSWNDAVAYAAWLSVKTGHHYRLPSASEWEYGARAGSAAIRPWGPDPASACDNANVADQSAARRYPGWEVFACDDGYVNTAPVSTFKSNAFGLDDMLGNVFQWTQDCWHADYAGAPVDGSARQDGDCSEHELRGGSWFSAPVFVRPAARNHFAATYRTSSVGFRLVRENKP